MSTSKWTIRIEYENEEDSTIVSKTETWEDDDEDRLPEMEEVAMCCAALLCMFEQSGITVPATGQEVIATLARAITDNWNFWGSKDSGNEESAEKE